jgi:transposase InsO family protein
MGEPGTKIIRTNGMNPWRAGCGGSRTSGSEGGPEKPTRRKPSRALRPDPYTYVKTHSGWVYVAFVVDVFSRMVVGWQASRSLRSDLAIDALEMAVHNRRRAAGLDGLIHHSDRGVQGELNRSSQHLVDGGACRWRRCGSGSARFSCIEAKSRLRAGRPLPGARTGSGSGLRSLVG